MKTPSPDQLRLAALWLRQNEAESGTSESESCKAVAAWLDKQADKHEEGAAVVRLARASGAKPAQVRDYCRRKGIDPLSVAP